MVYFHLLPSTLSRFLRLVILGAWHHDAVTRLLLLPLKFGDLFLRTARFCQIVKGLNVRCFPGLPPLHDFSVECFDSVFHDELDSTKVQFKAIKCCSFQDAVHHVEDVRRNSAMRFPFCGVDVQSGAQPVWHFVVFRSNVGAFLHN